MIAIRKKSIKQRSIRRSSSRRTKGALQAEWAMTMYVLFFFFMFPMLDFAVLGVRAFFLWFACNQAVMAGCKAHTLVNPVTIGTVTYQGALTISTTRASNVRSAFPGVNWTTAYPQIFIEFVPLNAGVNSPVYYPGLTPPGMTQSTTSTSPVTTLPDMNKYIAEYQVVITGTVLPFIPVPLIGTVPGLSGPVSLTVSSEAQFENPPGLTI